MFCLLGATGKVRMSFNNAVQTMDFVDVPLKKG